MQRANGAVARGLDGQHERTDLCVTRLELKSRSRGKRDHLDRPQRFLFAQVPRHDLLGIQPHRVSVGAQMSSPDDAAWKAVELVCVNRLEESQADLRSRRDASRG